MESLTSKCQTDSGGIRGLSELLIIKEVMRRLMAEENVIRERAGIEPLSKPPKPCECFDLIGGNSTGGCVTLYIHLNHCDIQNCLLQDNCANAWASSDGCRRGDQTL